MSTSSSPSLHKTTTPAPGHHRTSQLYNRKFGLEPKNERFFLYQEKCASGPLLLPAWLVGWVAPQRMSDWNPKLQASEQGGLRPTFLQSWPWKTEGNAKTCVASSVTAEASRRHGLTRTEKPPLSSERHEEIKKSADTTNTPSGNTNRELRVNWRDSVSRVKIAGVIISTYIQLRQVMPKTRMSW